MEKDGQTMERDGQTLEIDGQTMEKDGQTMEKTDKRWKRWTNDGNDGQTMEKTDKRQAKISILCYICITSLAPVYEFVCISFRIDNLNCFSGQVDHGGQYGNAARTRIRDETSETDIQKRRFCHGAISRTIKTLAILRCLYGSEMLLLRVVIRICETPTTNISQESGMACSCSHVNLWPTTRDKQQWTYFSFFPKSFS